MVDFEMPSLSQRPQSVIDQTVDNILTRLKELSTGVDFNKQAAFRLVPYLHGVLLAGTKQNLMEDLSSMNLASLASGTLDRESADRVAAMFGLTRKAGVKNTVSVLVVLSSNTPFVFAKTDTASVGAVKFSPVNSASVRASAATVSASTDLVLSQIGTGRWGVVISMESTEVGEAANVAVGTILSSSKTISGLVEMKVVASQAIGKSEETDSQLASRALSEYSVKSWAGRNSFLAMATNSGNFPALVAVSVVGFGDPEQHRDKRGVLPGSTGGRTDLWVKARAGKYSGYVSVSAVLTSKVGSVGTWSFTVGGQTAPGAYKIDHIVATDNQNGTKFYPGNQTIVSAAEQVNLVPLEGERYVPDVRSAQETFFSEFSNIQVLFEDNRYDVTSVNVGATRSYLAFVYYDPYINGLQQYYGSPDIRSSAGDVLVRHAIPADVFVAVELTGSGAADAATNVRNAIVAFINARPFQPSLSIAEIAAAAQSANSSVTVTVTSLACEILRANDTPLTIGFDGKKITLPTDTANLLSSKTIAFFTDVNKVSVAAV